ncbi:hypothetical protein BU16DRAFT_79352 [Lophium mytilinum]|uniref:Uncharacterized protein n=1 Tax=Lophium mytilinum TaxID=390894 RepID=A0A6A6QMB7_9PEZI|nr:hypothetical protein BU16DRAFT_79352 [Lophium mytilinum]
MSNIPVINTEDDTSQGAETKSSTYASHIMTSDDCLSGLGCTEIDFMKFPGEIRNKVYDLITYERMHMDHQYLLKPKGPLPVPMTDGLLELRLVGRQFSDEVFNRMFAWGATLRLNMIPVLPKGLDVRMETESTRKNMRATCPTGTANIAAEFGFRLRSYRPLGPVPSVWAKVLKNCQIHLLFRRCRNSDRCTACMNLNFHKEKLHFDIMPTLKDLIEYHVECFPDLPLLDVHMVQEQNWLSFEGKKMVERGVEEDFVATSEGSDGNALEWYLRTRYQGIKMKVQIRTMDNELPSWIEI